MFKAATANCDYRLFFVYCDLIFSLSFSHAGTNILALILKNSYFYGIIYSTKIFRIRGDVIRECFILES